MIQFSYFVCPFACRMWEWAYVGINASVPGDGGPECAAYLSKRVIWVSHITYSISLFYTGMGSFCKGMFTIPCLKKLSLLSNNRDRSPDFVYSKGLLCQSLLFCSFRFSHSRTTTFSVGKTQNLTRSV
jgi:hypothetical protein